MTTKTKCTCRPMEGNRCDYHEIKGRETQATYLNNVCIMQKHNDSENVLKLREEFNESEKYIIKAVNLHNELVETLKSVKQYLERVEKYLPDNQDRDEVTSQLWEVIEKASQ